MVEQIPSLDIQCISRGGTYMNVTVSKWGNSLGIRIPVMAVESLDLKQGDQVDFELKEEGGCILLKKQQRTGTSQLFEQFYGKPFSEITSDDIGAAEEFDWGEDVGEEIL